MMVLSKRPRRLLTLATVALIGCFGSVLTGCSLTAPPSWADLAMDYQEQGALALSQHKTTEAIKLYRKSLKEDPSSPITRIGLCSALQANQQWTEAQSEVENLLQLHPNFAPAYYNLGEIREHLGNIDGAKAAYKTYIDLSGKGNLPPSPELRIKFRKMGLL